MARAYTSMPNVVVGFVSKERSKSSGAMYAGVPTTFLLLLLLLFCSFGSLVPLVFCKNAMDCCVVTMPVICATRAHPTSHIFAPDPFNNTLCDFKSPCVIFNSCKYAHPAARRRRRGETPIESVAGFSYSRDRFRVKPGTDFLT